MSRIQAFATHLGQRMMVPAQRLLSRTAVGLETGIQRLGIFYILMGYLLGRAMILQDLAPFATAYFIVVYFIRKDKVLLTSIALLMGAASHSTSHAVMIFISLAIAFMILRVQEKRVKRELNQAPFIVLISLFISRAAYTYLSNEMTLYSTIMNVVEAVLAMVLTLIFVQSLPFLTSRKYHHELKPDEIVCLVILLASVMTGTIGWTIDGVSVQSTLAKYLVLTLAFVGGGMIGATVGVITGVIISLADVRLVEQISLLAFAGLLSGLLKEGKRGGAALGMILGSSIFILYVGDKQSIIHSSIETLMAVGLFLLTPPFLLQNISRFIPGTEENEKSQYEYMKKVRDVTVGKIMKFSTVFQELSDAFTQVSIQNKKEEEQESMDMNEFLARITERSCQTCWRKEKCWSEYGTENTVHILGELIHQLDAYGEIDRDRLEGTDYHSMCGNKEKLERVIYEEYFAVQEGLFMQKQVKDSRRLVADQLAGVSKVMRNFANELGREGIDLSLQEQQILGALENIGLSVQRVNILSLEEGKVDIEITQPVCDGHMQCESIIAPMLTSIVGENITVKSKECDVSGDGTCVVILGSEKNYSVSSYGTGVAKDGRLVSGDCFMTMELGSGKYIMAISDGMGNGDRAHLESTSTLQLLKELLEAGLDETLAIKSVNTVLSLRSPDEMFATVDLAIVDQYYGHTKFIKTGSNPSFIKRGREVFMITANNLPIGIIEDIEVDVVTEQLKPGDILIMVSDGLLEAPAQIENKEMWFKRIISELKTDDPEEITDILLERVIRSKFGEINDDMTILVSRIDQFIPRWGTFPIPGMEPIQRPKRVS
ncbi:stage II sporulation protein E [Ammoniphilus sp. CFH 90114]|uniref:stage II sporulation protein E n=1 Tax=Ammoniphilus sp. CFH 90114 TaxID=2493665 RepID=UPI00100E3B1F|nr:stage II sporulation protein E [Ammoniphilus sp. CFH 90114]RXT09015.1 stage II sporulation protein E [Ammoniphilus sp. CFH 90114]